jgi:hypothetical protein
VHLDRSTATGPAQVMPGPVAVCPGTDANQAFTLYHGDSDGTRGGVPLLGQFTERFDVAHDFLGPVRGHCELHHRNRRRVRGQDCVRIRDDLVEAGEDRKLGCHILDDRLDHEITIRERIQIVDDLDAVLHETGAFNLAPLLGTQEGCVDTLLAEESTVGGLLDDDHVLAGPSAHLGDSSAHQAAADDADQVELLHLDSCSTHCGGTARRPRRMRRSPAAASTPGGLQKDYVVSAHGCLLGGSARGWPSALRAWKSWSRDCSSDSVARSSSISRSSAWSALRLRKAFTSIIGSHLASLRLEDPPHGVDRRVVPVDERGRSDQAHRVGREVKLVHGSLAELRFKVWACEHLAKVRTHSKKLPPAHRSIWIDASC